MFNSFTQQEKYDFIWFYFEKKVKIEKNRVKIKKKTIRKKKANPDHIFFPRN